MTDFENFQKIGAGAYAAVAEMVAALNCDFDRLEELREMRDEVNTDENRTSAYFPTESPFPSEYPDEAAELKALEAAAGDCADREDAERRIEQDALSVEVRSAWHTPGGDNSPAEFCILLTTGGPAVRIVGDLDEHLNPVNPRLEAQDWGTPWTEYLDADEAVLLAYAQCFYFGE